jgi:hypothetical protein
MLVLAMREFKKLQADMKTLNTKVDGIIATGARPPLAPVQDRYC